MKRTTWRRSIQFALTVAVLSFVLGGMFDTSTIFLNHAVWFFGAITILVIVVVGALFDMLGVAAAAASETPFHAMASKRVFGARRAIAIVRNAERVSSVCSDVIGDIAGVLSGAGALAVGAQVAVALQVGGWHKELVIILLTALTTAITVGVKAIGKMLAIRVPTPIVLTASRIVDTVLISRSDPKRSSSRRR